MKGVAPEIRGVLISSDTHHDAHIAPHLVQGVLFTLGWQSRQRVCFLSWLLYGCFIRIGLDGNTRDGKSIKAHRFKNGETHKIIENTGEKSLFHCGKRSGGR